MSAEHIASPVIDGNTRVYFNSSDGNLHAFDGAGRPLRKQLITTQLAPKMIWHATLAIGGDGTRFNVGNDGWLYPYQ